MTFPRSASNNYEVERLKRLATLIALTTIVVLTACHDAPAGPDQAEEDGTQADRQAAAYSSQSSTEPTGLIPSEPRFEFEVEVRGNLSPGAPIRIDVTVTGVRTSDQTRLTIHLPGVEAAKRTDFGQGYRAPVNTPIPPEAEKTSGLARGRKVPLSATVIIPSPGYYRLVVGARSLDEQTAASDDWIPDSQYATRWLWISESDGKVTGRFNRRLFPQEAVIAPGPLRFHDDLESNPRQGALEREIRSFTMASVFSEIGDWISQRISRIAAHFGVSGGDETVQYEVVYWNPNTSQFEPVSFVNYQLEYEDCQGAGQDGCDQKLSGGWADKDGIVFPGCPSYYHTTYWGTLYSESQNVTAFWAGNNSRVDRKIGQFSVGHLCHTEPVSEQIQVTDDEIAWIVAKTALAASEATSSFGEYLSNVNVKADPGATGSSYNNGEITYAAGAPFSEADHWILGHEYGHAYQDAELGGLFANYSDNCAPHFFGQESSMGCAVSEGFADYVAEVITSAIRFGGNESAHTVVGSGEDGAQIEGAVAAFFHDLTDGSNETNDPVASYPTDYIGEVVRTCTINLWSKPSGIDHLIYCFENQIDPDVTGSSVYFPARSAGPSSYTESASEPAKWSAIDIRSSWTWNLYGEQ